VFNGANVASAVKVHPLICLFVGRRLNQHLKERVAVEGKSRMARTPPPRLVDTSRGCRAYREWLVTHVDEDVDPVSGALGWWVGYDLGHMQDFVPRTALGVVPGIGSTLRLYETPAERIDGIMIDGTMVMWDGRPVEVGLANGARSAIAVGSPGIDAGEGSWTAGAAPGAL
jgi:hypothetical protein